MNNPYSKFRYTNSYQLKFRACQGKNDVFGSELKSSVNNPTDQLVNESPIPFGVEVITNHLYHAERVTEVDGDLIARSYKRPKYFKLFKL